MILPKPPAEVPPCRDLTRLAPRFRLALGRALAEMHRAGFDPVVHETVRTDARQRFLYGFGREYDDGRGVVTQSRAAGNTWHSYGLAADVISRSLAWDAPAKFWRALEVAAEAEGLVSGADWDRNDATNAAFKDLPHVQFGPPMRRSPSPYAAALYADGGCARVWREVGAAP